MYPRQITYSSKGSFFLLGPRGTGKSTWVTHTFDKAVRFDLLESGLYQELLRHPSRLEAMIFAKTSDPHPTVILDEIQRLPELLNEVHRLIESKNIRFILTGSSARKLRKGGVNLLGGRARLVHMHPLSAVELGADFSLQKSLEVGHLPSAYIEQDPQEYLKSYIGLYLKEEVQQEALVRQLDQFAQFLEVAAYSQAAVLNVKNVSTECGVDRKTAENYFLLLEDLLIGVRLPIFQKKAKRKMASHPKFYYFDTGVYRALRKKGPLDMASEIEGAALETLVFQELRTTNENLNLEYTLSFWRTLSKVEIDFILYGPRGLIAIEVKRSSRFQDKDLAPLKLFCKDYPQAKGYLFYMGEKSYRFDAIYVIPIQEALPRLGEILGQQPK